jgi:hypothetical protein
VVVLDLKTFSIKNSIKIDDVIEDVQFFDSNDRFLSLSCHSSNKIIDLTTNQLYTENITVLAAVRKSKWNNKIYSCFNNFIN